MFYCYLDDSGTSGLPIVTMAGFIAHKSHWDYLEPKFEELLSGYQVVVLHAKEFHDTKGDFKNWKKIKKRSFADELFSVAHHRLMGVSMTVRRAPFEQHQRDTGQLPSMSAMGVCFSTIMIKIVTDDQIGPAVKQQGVSFFVEAGNKNNAGIKQFFLEMSANPTFEGCLREITFIEKGSCRAIQLADFFAFYSRRYMRDQDRFSGKLTRPACRFLQIMESHGPIWQRAGYGAPKPTKSSLDDLGNLAALAEVAKKPQF